MKEHLFSYHFQLPQLQWSYFLIAKHLSFIIFDSNSKFHLISSLLPDFENVLLL